MEDFNHTVQEVELPLAEEEPASTSDDTSEESVETFDDALDSAETDEDLAALGESLRPQEEEVVEEPTDDVAEDDIDTPTEDETPSFNLGNGFKIKDGDIELNITDEAKLRQLAQMGLNYGGKTTELAKHRSFVKYAEDNDISLNDIQMLKDIKSGNKDAYSALAKSSGIDMFDVPEEHAYAPEPVQLPAQVDPMVDIVANEILSNEEHTTQFQKWLPHMPEEVRAQVTTDANALRAVQADINAGIFDRAMNQAYSDMRVNGMEFNTAYLRAKEMIVGTQAEPTPSQARPTITRGDRVRASSNRGSASAPSKSYGAISDMTNDDFLENFNDIISGLERPQ